MKKLLNAFVVILRVPLVWDFGTQKKSKKQTTVSLSTGEAKYIAASSCCCQVLWIQHQMMDYGINFLHTPLFWDNEAAVGIAKNPIHHTRTKHIETRIHAIRDTQEKGFINIIPIETRKQKSDLFTKTFDKPRFYELISMLGLISF
ncbi:hypothetical protein QVD17_08521 [Tagetes erecta]|uniref:Copia protein n=1 Tax=Tagetes erecta TaxID=13708 RepID=A0AAD8P386_TARER|nr:hypothetical protein QVD17_08521 [Tagetes erecta]